MGDSTLLTKFRETCDDHEADLTIDGVVENFDTVYPVPPERLTRGIVVSSGETQRVVDFGRVKWPAVNIGDRLVIVGRNSEVGRKSVQPIVILNPTEHLGSFSRLITKRQEKRFIAYKALPIVIVAITWLGARMIIPTLNIEFFFIAYILAIVLQGSFWSYYTRPRSYSIDEATWNLLMREIADRFNIKIGEWV